MGTKYFGNAYIIKSFLAGRKSVVKYLKKISNINRNLPQQVSIEKAIKKYQKVVEFYEKLSELFPHIYSGVLNQEKISKGASLIRILKKLEEEGVNYLEQALNEWN